MKNTLLQSKKFGSSIRKNSESERSDDDSVTVRPTTMGGRIRIWNKMDQAPSTDSSFLGLGHDCVCKERVKKIKKKIIEKEKLISRALKLIRKDQRRSLFENQNSFEDAIVPMQSNDIVDFLSQDNRNMDKLHLAVLYASPLGYEVVDKTGSKTFKVIQELNFHNDIDNITNALEGGMNQVNYSIRMGTSMNFISSVSKNPYVLHFIGHGISNQEIKGKKEDCLVLENEDGSGQLVSSQKLKMILDVCNSKLDVVFLSSCYSENQSEVFLNAGAQHVVCIERSKKVMDEACIKFSSVFYQALFNELRTPCEAYNIAQQTLSISQGLEGQSALFIMKTRNSIEEQHCCRSHILYKGVTSRVDKLRTGIRFVKNLPSKPCPFVGRNQDVREVLQILKLGKRIITITGEPGIGKTTVAYAVIHYLIERDEELIKNGVVFLNGNNCASLPTWLHTFNTKIIESHESFSANKLSKKDTLQVFKEIMKKLKDLDLLLIIDNAESFLISINVLKQFLEMIFKSSQKIKVLLTSKIEPIQYLGGIIGVEDSVIRLKPLTIQFSERLLCEKAGKMIPKDERLKLQKREPERIHAGFKNGYQHLFGYLLGGHPITISLAANIYSTSNLNHLYETLIKSTILNSLTQGTGGDLVVNKLTLSLNLSLKLYNNKKIYDFFNLMGYLPGGARQEDIDSLWQSVTGNTYEEWFPFCTYLEKASIIMRKTVKQDKNEIEIFQLVPMIKNVAEETSKETEKKKIHKIVTQYYIQILENILKENSVSGSSEKNQSVMNKLWFFEMNIWECVYRALEIKKNIDFSEIDRNNSMWSVDKSRDPSPERESRQDLERMQKRRLDDALDMDLIKLTPKDSSEQLNNVILNISKNASLKNASMEESSQEDDSAIEDLQQKSKPSRAPTENNMLNLMMKNKERSIKEEEDDNIFNEIIKMVKPQIMPRTTSNDLQDSNVLSFIEKSVMPNKTDKKLIQPKPKVKKKKVDAGLGDNSSFLIREMDKKLKRTINQKVANIIKSNKKLSSLSMPKEEVYAKLSHKLMEMQEQHKLYKGDATNEVSKKGKTVKKINDDSKIMILYLTNLILFSKKTDVVKVIEEYGKYFYDKNLCEANLRKLKGLALIRNKKDTSFETSTEAIKEFLYAKVIFQKHDCHHGVGICCAGVGFILYEIFTHYVKNKLALLDYAKRTFIESLNNYTLIAHDYGMSYCYDMLQDIKRGLGQNFSEEYRRYMTLQSKILNDTDLSKSTFIERVQGVEMSLLIENIMEVTTKATLLDENRNGDVDEMVKYIIDRKKMVESVNQANEQEYNNHMLNFIAIVSDPGRGDSQVFIPVVNKQMTEVRQSIEPKDRGSFKNVFNQIPMGIKAREKFKSKLKINSPKNSLQLGEGGSYLKSLTSVKNKVSVNFTDTAKKLRMKRTKTLNSDDLSEDSSDLEFCHNHRIYSKLQKVEKPVVKAIQEDFLTKLEKSRKSKDMNLVEIEEESTIQMAIFKNKQRNNKPLRKADNESSNSHKGKFRMRNFVKKLKSNRYNPTITEKMKGHISPNLPSISIVPLKSMMTDKDIAKAALRAAVNRTSHHMSLQ
ncbi:unnamed protein product [Moneuplotes crassus]|uniref:AAA+ ATPase domain-containing protein n=1 Tax=Euplotes crassus TaxID=5936 RepID=A0AAD1X4Y7_EUPCR|nr:unnamed protein product [Moneuplotes crassus]